MVLTFDTAIDIWDKLLVQAQESGVAVPLLFEIDIRTAQRLKAQSQRDPRATAVLIKIYEHIIERLRPEENPNFYSGIQNNLGIAYRKLPTGDRASNLAQAVRCYHEALRFWTPEDLAEYAMVQNNLVLRSSLVRN